MKLNLLIILVISVVLCLSGCKLGSSDNVDKENKVEENKELTYGGKELPSTEGKVIKIDDDNTIVIEVMVNRDGYKVGDKVRVKFEQYFEKDRSSLTSGTKEVMPKLGDVVDFSYLKSEVDSKDGMNVITTLEVYVFKGEYSDIQDKENNETVSHMNVIEGKVVEVIDKNIILLEITKERGGYSIGDNVKVEYEKYIEENENSDISTDNSIVPDVDDIVGVQFSESEKDGEEEMDLIVVGEVYKYVE